MRKEKISEDEATLFAKNNNAITLIALVITIIVLLILAGVTISLTLGDEGIFKMAEKSVEKQKIAEYQERIDLARSKVLANKEGTITIDDLINQIYEDNIVEEGNITKIDEEKAQLMTKEGYEFIITTNKTEYIGINEVPTVKISKVVVGIEENYINILVTIEDEEHGIKEVVKPDGLAITSNNEAKVEIYYKVEEGKEYIFKITNGEGKVKNGVVTVNLDKDIPQIRITDIASYGFTILLDTNYPDNIIEEYKYYVDGTLVNKEKTNNKEYDVTELKGETNYKNIYVEVYFKESSIPVKSNIVETKTTPIATHSVNFKKLKLKGPQEQMSNGELAIPTGRGQFEEDGSLRLWTADGWNDTYAYLKLYENLNDYSKFSITFSYTPGYYYGFGLINDNKGTSVVVTGNNTSSPSKVEKETKEFDIPSDFGATRMYLRAGSMKAYLYIYDITLIK